MVTNFIAWIVLGLIAGYVASMLVDKRGEGLILDMVLGIIGAMIGGWLFHALGTAGVTGLNLWSIVVAIVGAALFLIIWHGIRRSWASN
jgi:uncharacterized membrane protein YeaQ/YmgE (transglycosylase-associated protein family)